MIAIKSNYGLKALDNLQTAQFHLKDKRYKENLY
jgi:hypothetical protein